jgi:hypothetical protein
MRDRLVYVADGSMAESVAGLLNRPGIHHAIGCAQFSFDSRSDIKIAAGQYDPGVYTRADELMRPFADDYLNAVVIADAEWTGSPGAICIEQQLRSHLENAGWPPERGLALVVSPEADLWLWSNSPHTASALGWESWDTLRPALEDNGWLLAGDSKPARPKEAAAWALRNGRVRGKPPSRSLFREVSAKVSVQRCQEPAFLRFLAQLRAWFPLEQA